MALKIWICNIIPKTLPAIRSRCRMAQTMIPGPLPVISGSFLTDQRTFGLIRKGAPHRLERLVLATVAANHALANRRHEVKGGLAYSIALADLRRLKPVPSKEPVATTTQLGMAETGFAPGDRLIVAACFDDANGVRKSLEVEAAIVSGPDMAPPAAFYGLATRDIGAEGRAADEFVVRQRASSAGGGVSRPAGRSREGSCPTPPSVHLAVRSPQCSFR